MLQVFVNTFETNSLPGELTRILLSTYVQESVEKCETILACGGASAGVSKSISTVITLMETFGSQLFQHPDFAVVCSPPLLHRSTVLNSWQRMDNMFINHAFHILQASPQAISAFMSFRNDQDRCLELWHVLLVALSQQIDILSSLINVIHADTCPKYLRPEDDELDGVIEHLFLELLSGETSRVDLLKRVIQAQSESVFPLMPVIHCSNIGFFLSENGQDILFETLVSSLSSTVNDILYTANTSFTGLATVMDFTRIMLNDKNLNSDSSASLLPNIFIVGYLLPVMFPTLEASTIDIARGIWVHWVSKADNGLQGVLGGIIKERLKDLVQDCSVCTRSVRLSIFIAFLKPLQTRRYFSCHKS